MNGERDVGAEVRAALPAGLAEKLVGVETALGHPVRFLADSAIRDNARGSANPDGTIRLLPQHVANMAVVAEEIMHLHRRMQGYPLIEPTNAARLLGFEAALLRLGGHFDEVAFFGFLEELGLNPRGEIRQSVEAEIEAVQRMIPRLAERNHDPALPIELAVVYLRAAMLAPEGGPEQRAMLQLFDAPVLAGPRELGRALCNEIDIVRNGSPDDVGQSMQRCLGYLRVTDQGATVRMFGDP